MDAAIVVGPHPNAAGRRLTPPLPPPRRQLDTPPPPPAGPDLMVCAHLKNSPVTLDCVPTDKNPLLNEHTVKKKQRDI